jgi:hypothetical protein
VALQNKSLRGEDERFNHVEKYFLDNEVIEDWTEMNCRGVRGHDWDSTPLLSRPPDSPC